MRKRERENPCVVCGHYHKYEEGEVCATCGHRIPASFEKSSTPSSAFPSEILPDFLYLGSYDNASRAELLKTQGISRVLNVSKHNCCRWVVVIVSFKTCNGYISNDCFQIHGCEYINLFVMTRVPQSLCMLKIGVFK